jgi:hypothetical protein
MTARLTKQDLLDYQALLENELGLKVVEKTTSWFMKALARLLFFNKNFLEGYITIIGKTIYWPNMAQTFGDNPVGDFSVMFHEGQHEDDRARLPVLYELAYISPQVLALLMLLFILGFWFGWWWFIAILLVGLLAPVPSPGRMFIEMRGYGCNFAFYIWYHGRITQGRLEGAVKEFTSVKTYYGMWPFKQDVCRRLAKIERNVRGGKLTRHQRRTYKFLEERSLINGNSTGSGT